jgi:hypothetical protein
MKGTFTQSLFFTLLRASLVLLSGLLLWLAAASTLDAHIQPITFVVILWVLGGVSLLFYPVLPRLLRRLQRGDDVDASRYHTPTGFSMFAFAITILLMQPIIVSAQAPSCSCNEYLYVNEPNGIVHKMRITAGGGALTEVGGVNGIPWLNDIANFPFPHGLGVDRNGFLYIGTNYGNPNQIRKLDCLGNLKPTSEFVAPTTGNWGYLLSNITSYQGFIYANGLQSRIYKIDPCTGNTVGYVQLSNASQDDWGLHVDKNGKFFVTQQYSGRLYAFTPIASDFVSNTTYSPFIDLDADPTLGGALSPQFSGTGLQGITTDPSGNIYVIEGDRDNWGTPSRLLKFTAAGAFIAAGPIDSNGGDNAGWNMMTGIVYSATSGKLYTTSLNSTEDCIYRWNTDLTPDGAAVGPVPNPFGQCKAIGILSECCPTSGTVDASSCNATLSSRISLSDLLTCDGVICDGQWALQPGSTNFTYNSCDITATPTGLPACATLTLTNAGVSNAPCAPYTITVNASLLASVTAQQIAGNQTVCPSDDPAAFTVTLAASTTGSGSINYQWQRSTTSCLTGFTNIPGANSATYDPGSVSQTTYYRVVASITGCTAGLCESFSNCVTLTLGVGCAPACPTLPCGGTTVVKN